MLTYYTHNNGGRPFKVELDTNAQIINVYDTNESVGEDREHILLHTLPFQEYFIGVSMKCITTQRYKSYGSQYDGNTVLILVKTENDKNVENVEKQTCSSFKYTFIGDRIFTFCTTSRIVAYCSPVGNSDVPYPYARDEEGCIYLLIENIKLTPNELTKDELDVFDDPYMFWYEARQLTSTRYKDSQDDLLYDHNLFFDRWYVDDGENGESRLSEYTMNVRTKHNPSFKQHRMFVRDKSTKLLVPFEYTELQTLMKSVMQKLGATIIED